MACQALAAPAARLSIDLALQMRWQLCSRAVLRAAARKFVVASGSLTEPFEARKRQQGSAIVLRAADARETV
jgi:hypothetical protein